MYLIPSIPLWQSLKPSQCIELFNKRRLPFDVDIFSNLETYVKETFPGKNKIVIFDKDETMISPNKDWRHLHTHLKEQVFDYFYKMDEVLVIIFTLSWDNSSMKDFTAFPDLLCKVDLIITGDNVGYERMNVMLDSWFFKDWNPTEMEKERIHKPIQKMFPNMTAVLLDDQVWGIWNTAIKWTNAVKAYDLESDSREKALMIRNEIETLLYRAESLNSWDRVSKILEQ